MCARFSKILAGPSCRLTPKLLRSQDMAALLESGTAADMTFKVEDEEMKVHRIILQVRHAAVVAAGSRAWLLFPLGRELLITL